MRRSRRGLTLIELVIVVIIIAILAAIALPRFSSTTDRAHTAAMRTDLRNLAQAQEGYAGEKNTYASDPAELTTFRFSPGVRLVGPMTASPSGWSATVEHPQVSPYKCTIFMGAAPVAPATDEGVVACGN